MEIFVISFEKLRKKESIEFIVVVKIESILNSKSFNDNCEIIFLLLFLFFFFYLFRDVFECGVS